MTSIGGYAFSGCSSLSFVTIGSGVTSIGSSAFLDCSGLTSITIGSGVTSIGSSAFNNCSRLRSVYAEGTKAASIESSTFPNRSNQTLHVPVGCKTAYEESDYWWEFKTIIDDIVINVPYTVLSSDSTTLTFRCDSQKHDAVGTVYECSDTGNDVPGWYDSRSKVTKVVMEASFKNARSASMFRWFSGMVNLANIEGLENLNTSEAKYMSYMFLNCQKLESLDLSHFDTSKVQLMGYMFQGCTNLKNIDLSSFNTSANTSFYRMFMNCTSLESLDISSFTFTESVESRYFFLNCTGLKN